MPLEAWTWSWNTIHHYYSSLGQSETTRPGQLQGVRNWKEERWRTSHACDQPHYISSVFSSLRLNISDTASFPLTSHHHDIWPKSPFPPEEIGCFLTPTLQLSQGPKEAAGLSAQGKEQEVLSELLKRCPRGEGREARVQRLLADHRDVAGHGSCRVAAGKPRSASLPFSELRIQEN